MGAFDKVIGYEHIKEELLQVCDMIKNRDVYEKLGAKLPQGVLLYGEPGLGKTLMAQCFVEESGLKSYTVRRAKGKEDFIEYISKVFQEAKDNAPALILLDDMDKFANEDAGHKNAEEYVAIQSGIDSIKGCNVLVIATANELANLPDSLIRAGRFDKQLYITSPTKEDTSALIEHFLSDKKISDNVNIMDLSKMIVHISCAELETIMNEAAIIAASERKRKIEMADLVHSILRTQYDTDNKFNKVSAEEFSRTAIHEAGHLVVAEVLEPESIGLISIRQTGEGHIDGFVRRCKILNRRQDIMISLAGKVATELYFSETCASGCQRDLRRATDLIYDGIFESGTNGVGLLRCGYRGISASQSAQLETATHAELERYMFKVRDILTKNKSLLEEYSDALIEKGTLLFSDIQKIKENVGVDSDAFYI